jgi:hypothetical protein
MTKRVGLEVLKSEKSKRSVLQPFIQQERLESMRMARVFESVCSGDSADAVVEAARLVNETVDGWRLSFLRVARLENVSEEVKAGFLNVWIEHKSLARVAGHRPTVARALRVLMPRNYSGPPIQLYRGTRYVARLPRYAGFSWTTNLDTARSFAEQYTRVGQSGVVLSTLAPAAAVLLRREKDWYFDEDEVVIDPYRLSRVMRHEVLEQQPVIV